MIARTQTESRHATSSSSAIGGFFELEIPQRRQSFHANALALSTGRACLTACLNTLKPTRAFLPQYTCDATLHSFQHQKIEIVFYNLDANFQPIALPMLEDTDCILVTNYWGLQRKLIRELSQRFEQSLIVDNTHDFYFEDNTNSWSFTSARKWFGVPDGAFLYPPHGFKGAQIVPPETPRNENICLSHLLQRWKGNLQDGFSEFKNYERTLGIEVQQISNYSSSVLSSLNLSSAAIKRRANYYYLDHFLKATNQVDLKQKIDSATPFSYPYLPQKPIPHKLLHDEKIFVPRLWDDVLRRNGACRNSLRWSKNLLSLPIDHRYGLQQMQYIVDIIKQIEADHG